MYLSAPARKPIEDLGLLDPANSAAAASLLKRRFSLSAKEFWAMAGLEGRRTTDLFYEETPPSNQVLRTLAELCDQHSVTSDDLESERSQPRMLRRGKSPNEQIVFSSANPDSDLRGILHQSRRDTGFMFLGMAQAANISPKYFFHFTRPEGTIPNAGTQTKIFDTLKRAYEISNLEFPLYLKRPDRQGMPPA